MEALVGQEAQFVSDPVRKAEPVKSVTHGCSHRCTGRQLKDEYRRKKNSHENDCSKYRFNVQMVSITVIS